MKLYIYIILSVFLLGCDSEDGPDCFKKQGEQITKQIETEIFSKINISDGIELTVKESEEQTITITAGKNLIGDIQFEVIDGELLIKDKNGCEILRNTSVAKVHVSVPNLEKIYSSSQFSIHSDGVLHFPNLTLESGIIIEDSPASVFEMVIENESLTINDNISSVFKITGNTHQLNINFWGSNGRLEAGNFHANEVSVFHRSTNDMIVYPIEKVSGTIYSTGNLVLRNVPPIVEIEQLYTGHVVYP